MSTQVRQFRDEDFWQVENLERLFMDNDPHSPPIIVRQMQNLFGPFFLIAQDEESLNIQGYVMGGIEFENKSIGWVLGIFVKEEFRNQEIGSKLISELINRMKKYHVTEIRLTVDPQNFSALKVYHKNGFHDVDCLVEHYRKGKKVYLMKYLF